jgi:hypothetical protein
MGLHGLSQGYLNLINVGRAALGQNFNSREREKERIVKDTIFNWVGE